MPKPLPPIGAEVIDMPGLPPIGAEVSAAQPDFRSTNELDASGQALLRREDRSPVADFLTEATAGINPLNWAKAVGSMLKDPSAAARAMYEGRTALSDAAVKAFQSGDYVTGTAKTIEWLIPFLGERMSQSGDYLQQGEIAKGLGAAVDVAGQVVAPKMLAGSKAAVRVPPAIRNVNPVERAAVEFGVREGIPVDAATATGNRYIRGVQKLADESILGSVAGSKAVHAQGEALTRTGAKLMDRTAPVPVTAEQAGEGIRRGVYDTVKRHAGDADDAYGRLRKAEENYLHGDYVPEDLPKPVKERMRESLGGELPSSTEIQELRRIREELDAVPFQSGKLSRDAGAGYDAGDTTYSHRAAGAPVYHDILQAAPGTSNITREAVQDSIDTALKTGRFTNAARGALAVAKKRLAAPGSEEYAGLSKPILPPEAGEVQQAMLLPVDLRQAKIALKPLYTSLMREREITGVLQGTKARAAKALDNLMLAPDHAPLSVVDGALSELKSMARSDIPELRGAGKSAAAFAVKHLDTQVQAAAAKAGPDVLKALTEGRTATKAKYAAGEILESLREEPVGVYRQATAPRDAQIGLLRELQTLAPKELPKVGRAVLEGLLTKATKEGGFNRAQGLQAEWQMLGAETKRLLYRDPKLIQDLDHFFLLAKKMAENPNPSGSALTVVKGGEITLLWNNPLLGSAVSIGAAGLSKLLHSPRAVRLLNRGLRLPVGNKAAATAFAGELATVAREAGVQLAPAVSQADPQESDNQTPVPAP